jgi:mono/diheme cytochrome c family protein
MTNRIRFQGVLAAVVLLAGTMSFAQSSGEATYKAKCQNCHGATGMADTAVGKALKVKPVTDPEVRKFTAAAMVEATRNGMGKMQPFKDKLSDAQIKESVDHFRSFIK